MIKLAQNPSVKIGVRINDHFIGVDWQLWETFESYDAKEEGGHVFIREQVNTITGKKRRVVSLPKGHERRPK